MKNIELELEKANRRLEHCKAELEYCISQNANTKFEFKITAWEKTIKNLEGYIRGLEVSKEYIESEMN